MGLLHYLFGFSGRINRAKMWLYFLLWLITVGVAVYAVLAAVGFGHLIAIGQHKEEAAAVFANPALMTTFRVLGLLYIVLFWIELAVKSKRLHDRNKSAWWLLVFVALPSALGIARLFFMFAAMHAHGSLGAGQDPVGTLLGGASLLIQLWAFVELYCFSGTTGENRYGPDPLA